LSLIVASALFVEADLLVTEDRSCRPRPAMWRLT
jgi:hypothetical protein